MAAPDWPLRDASRSALNGASDDAWEPQRSSGSVASLRLLDHLDSPQLAQHDFHNFPHSLAFASSPELEYQRVRRKASTVNLTANYARYTDPAAYWLDDPWTPSLILPRSLQSTPQQPTSPSFAHHRPLTPRPRTYTASPSLSSTVDTLQSSPFQTPVYQRCPRVEPGEDDDEDRSDLAQPIRTKRKFDSLKRAKRLPHQSHGSGSSDQGQLWEVYAAVFEIEEDIGQAEERADLQNTKSVRFEIGSEKKESSATEAPVNDSQNTREGHSSSSASLSRFDWPLPPSHDNWQGTFGHLNTTTPPPTPATVLYRGASFDVLNPHASLVLGSRTLETPAEIDGLLDSYFEDQEDDMQRNIAQGEPSPTSTHVPSESSRRVLYESADDARRNILRIEQQNKPQVTMPPKAVLRASGSQKSARPFSDPFDLTLGDDSSQNTLMNMDHVLQEGCRDNATLPARMQPLGLGIADPDDTHATSEQTTDPTIKAILAGYDYTRVPLSQLERQMQEQDIGTSPMIEYGRGDPVQQPSYESSHGLLTPLQTRYPERAESSGAPVHKPYSPVALPRPPQPVYTRANNHAGSLHYWTDCSELPTTEHSYGNTNQLLNITTEEAHYPPYVPHPPCHPATCVDPAHIHMPSDLAPICVFSDPDSDTPVASSVQPYFDDNKENIPPADYKPGLASIGMHGDTTFRFPNTEDDDEDGDLARAMPRSSSFYPDDGESEWVTEYGFSQHDLHRDARYSAASADSYANTSFVESQYRFSLPPAAGQIPLSPVEDNSPPPPLKALGVPGESAKVVTSNENIAERRRLQIEARISTLESKIAQEQVASKYAGSPNIDRSERRADLAELEYLRRLLPSTSRHFALKASESLDTIKATAQDKLQKAKTFVRPQYQPKVNFSRAMGLGRQDAAFNSGSDTRGLLASPDTPSPYTNFGYSESTGTFMTIQQGSPLNMRGAATNLWSPFDKDPTHRAINIKSSIGKKPKIVDIELGPMGSKSKRSHRAAIGSQYEPRDLHLVRSKRMTDAQLVARSPGWTMAPSNAVGSPSAGGGDWSSSSTYPMLLQRDTGVDKANRLEQKRISKRFLYGCAAFPPLTLLFGCGFFDNSVARLTAGKVREACAKEKRKALVVVLPLGLIFWAVLIIAIFLMATITKGDGEQGSSPF